MPRAFIVGTQEGKQNRVIYYTLRMSCFEIYIQQSLSYKLEHIPEVPTFPVNFPHPVSIEQWFDVLDTCHSLWMRFFPTPEDCHVLSLVWPSCYIFCRCIAASDVHTVGPPPPSTFNKASNLRLVCNINRGVRSNFLLVCAMHSQIKRFTTEDMKIH
jgi:hypothetical protein